MKSISIHGLDDKLDKRIKQKANKEGLSLNKTIKKLLEEALGINKKKKQCNNEEFLDFFGVWNARDEKAFDSATADFEKIDPGEFGDSILIF